MDNTLLVDELEACAQELQTLQNQLHRLDAQYRKSFDRTLREEMESTKKTMGGKRAGIKELLYDRLRELGLLRRHFPALFKVLCEDNAIGSLVKEKEWILDFRKQSGARVETGLADIRARRNELRAARAFLSTWTGTIDARSLGATWPVLKPHLSGEMERDEAQRVLDGVEQRLRRQGWLLMLNEPHVFRMVKKFLAWLEKQRKEEREARLKKIDAEGQGSRAEYDALRGYEQAQRKRRHHERILIHLLRCNPDALRALQQKKPTAKPTPADTALQEMVAAIPIRPVNEKAWLERMRKRLE